MIVEEKEQLELKDKSLSTNKKIKFLDGLKREFIEQGLDSPIFESEVLLISSTDIIKLNNKINRAIEDDFVSEHKSLMLADRYRCRK